MCLNLPQLLPQHWIGDEREESRRAEEQSLLVQQKTLEIVFTFYMEWKRNRSPHQKRVILAGIWLYFSPNIKVAYKLFLSQHPTHLREKRSWWTMCFTEHLPKTGFSASIPEPPRSELTSSKVPCCPLQIFSNVRKMDWWSSAGSTRCSKCSSPLAAPDHSSSAHPVFSMMWSLLTVTPTAAWVEGYNFFTFPSFLTQDVFGIENPIGDIWWWQCHLYMKCVTVPAEQRLWQPRRARTARQALLCVLPSWRKAGGSSNISSLVSNSLSLGKVLLPRQLQPEYLASGVLGWHLGSGSAAQGLTHLLRTWQSSFNCFSRDNGSF